MGDIVKFQVEEDLKAKARELVDDLRAFGGVELAANLEEAGRALEPPRQGQCRAQTVVVQGDDQS